MHHLEKKQEIGERLAEVCIYQKHPKEDSAASEFNSGVPKAVSGWGAGEQQTSGFSLTTILTHCATLCKWQMLWSPPHYLF